MLSNRQRQQGRHLARGRRGLVRDRQGLVRDRRLVTRTLSRENSTRYSAQHNAGDDSPAGARGLQEQSVEQVTIL